jgi:hypothetical protein
MQAALTVLDLEILPPGGSAFLLYRALRVSHCCLELSELFPHAGFRIPETVALSLAPLRGIVGGRRRGGLRIR